MLVLDIIPILKKNILETVEYENDELMLEQIKLDLGCSRNGWLEIP